MTNPVYQRVLLTGGAGFIGSHIAEAFLRRGCQLSIVDDLDDFYSPARKRANLEEVRQAGEFDFFEVDICDKQALRGVLASARPELVVHLAARAGVRPSIEFPELYERVNVGGTTNLLELCRKDGVRKLIFGSSSSVYGATSQVPFSEDHVELRPISPYAATKLAGEMLCHTYAHLFGLPVVCLRFFTVYGPRQRPDLAIHKFISLMEKGRPLPLYGDGSTGRDYTFVEDIVSGVLATLNYEPRSPLGIPFEVFNLGNSHPVKLLELIDLLEKVSGRTAVRDWRPDQPGDMPLTWADISKARQRLGYTPATPLENGLKRFLAWYRASERERSA